MKCETHTRDKNHYEELYDRITVEICRDIEQRFLSYKFKPDEKTKKLPSKEEQKAAVRVAAELRLMWEVGERYSKKEQTIEEWMERDRAKDDLLENTNPPRRIRCEECRAEMEVEMKTLYDLFDSPERVLFFFACNRCKGKKAIFDDGEEFKKRVEICPDCGAELEEESSRKGDTITTFYVCVNCEHSHEAKLDVGTKEEKEDPDFERDRKRFCPTGKRAERYVQGVQSMRGLARLQEEFEQQEKDKPYVEEIKKIDKLGVPQLGDRLSDVLEETGYVKLELSKPEIDQQVVVTFSIQDDQVDRKEKDSVYELRKLIRTALKDTNWRLMSDGIEYRLGVLSGRLKGYDREEDMMNLAKQRLKQDFSNI